MTHCEDDGEAERESRGLPLIEGEALAEPLSVKSREAEVKGLCEAVMEAADEELGEIVAWAEAVTPSDGVRLPDRPSAA